MQAYKDAAVVRWTGALLTLRLEMLCCIEMAGRLLLLLLFFSSVLCPRYSSSA